jgi:hypothetical protein
MSVLCTVFSVIVAAVAASGCAHLRSGVPAGPSQSGLVPADRTLLGKAEIARSGAPTALDAVRVRRPDMLRRRGQDTPARPTAEPVVYVDGMREAGGLAALSNLPSSGVSEIRFLSGNDATIRYGAGHGSGAILVRTLPVKTRE